jgi:cbb3-type cytochrome oxidase subunit 1
MQAAQSVDRMYNYNVVRQFSIAAVVWGVVACWSA